MTHASALIETVRRVAPRICAAAGRAYDPVLLANGLPASGDEEPGIDAPMTLSDLIATWLAKHPDRRRDGVYLTPRVSARSLLLGAAADGFHPRSVCDPAVGAGVFLEEAISLFGPDAEVWGIDCDPIAVALSRLRVWLAAPGIEPNDVIRRIRVADSLLDPDPFAGSAPPQGFDLVCGNPPFGNAIEKRTARSETERAALRSVFPETARGPYDRSLLFVDLATRLLSPGGRYALLVPRALMAARYATGLRGLLERAAPIERILRFERDAPVPECEIFMVGWVGSRDGCGRAPQVAVAKAEDPGATSAMVPRDDLRDGSWGSLLDPDGAWIEKSAAPHPRLGDSFEVTASASVGEAYAMSPSIREASEGGEDGGDGEGWRLLTVRLITRYRHRWGSVSGRILGRLLREPFLPRDASGLTPKRAALYDRPKIVVAGLSRNVKAICDAKGIHAGSVGTLCAVPRGMEGEDARRLLRRATLLLNSGWISAIHRARRGPLALAGGSLPLSRSDLADLPFPVLLTGKETAVDGASLREWLGEAEPALPGDPGILLGILDAAANALLDGIDGEGPNDPGVEGWDPLVQRVIDEIAGREWSRGRARS